MTQKTAVVLLSGGLDSATVLAIAKNQGFICHAISFDYGQRHHAELAAAAVLAAKAQVAHHAVIRLDLRAIGGSALTADMPVPKDRAQEHMATGIPVTYVPARNTVFLSLALGYAEVVRAFDIFIGVNALDYSGYPDCRPEFIHQFQRLANVATKAALEKHGEFVVHAPLLKLRKAEIISLGHSMGVDYSQTVSCYDPNGGAACGRCDACQLRLAGFREAGLEDPVRYA